jgi:hypothetical protein
VLCCRWCACGLVLVCPVNTLPPPPYSLSYFLIQGPAFAYDCGRGTECHKKGKQHWWAFTGILSSLIAFIAYLVYQGS